ncbi:hypothetical protein KOR34_47670 [Posidoniimonas corsicana]|uniref:DUF3500 domain-containing protein n=1 Tax=Posidoniimonas corsicana TaxID=1938618 RepID=A0A5C5UWG2_9BACT|nr:DUF3500 domain-containing protein [Posidoniimonas corsicana]TWT30209.1 hypothetical protein KOR34_47670 [Posidoniimonas corsicana]
MKTLLLVPLVLLAACPALGAETPHTPTAVVAQAVEAADSFIATLNDAQRKAVRFDFSDDEQRRRWSNLPAGMYPRNGLRWGDLNQQQRDAAMQLFSATLSPRGVQQVIDNMQGDEVLKQQGGGGRADFGADAYYLSILGTPSADTPWMWQFGGHHLAINATLVGDQVTLSPSLTGGQPVDYEVDGRQVRQLAEEEDLSFELIGSLSPDQRQAAILGDHHANMIYGPGKEGAKPKPEGLNAGKLDDRQRELLLSLIEARIGVLNQTHAERAMQAIKQNLAETWFSWYGPTTPGAAATFRVQGPTLLMEYSPQHLGGDDTQHTHAMYRDPANDYGAAWVKQADR